jgi:hypothetical protein
MNGAYDPAKAAAMQNSYLKILTEPKLSDIKRLEKIRLKVKHI